MSDTELVIKISEEKLSIIKNKMYCGIYDSDLYKAIENGTPLPNDVARERYKDLCEYFGDTKDILKSRKDFKAWLERIKWHVRKAEELYEKYEHKQEPCDDVVSRQAVINLVRGRNSALEEPRIFNSHNSGVVFEHYINDLPPVRPQEQTGHWILKRTFPTKLYDEYLNEYKCSECYRKIRCTESQLVNYPYCHCGAKMESEDKE